jgi:ABC-2 type transport system ATP-binding protein
VKGGVVELHINNVSKTYANGVRALVDVNLTIGPGMFGLLGPNGAGKSTLMRTIATLQEPDHGSITFGGIDVLGVKKRIRETLGYLPQEFGVYPKVRAEALLDHLALLKGLVDRHERHRVVDHVLRLTNLEAHRKKLLGGFSGGMKQRFGIAQALLGKPRLLIVDEPTAGLDPEERIRFHNLLNEIGEITVVILSTHIVADVSDICTDMAIIDEGRLLLHEKPATAVQSLRGRIWEKIIDRADLELHRKKYSVISARQVAGRATIHIQSDTDPGDGFVTVEPDLHDVYFMTTHQESNGVEQ